MNRPLYRIRYSLRMLFVLVAAGGALRCLGFSGQSNSLFFKEKEGRSDGSGEGATESADATVEEVIPHYGRKGSRSTPGGAEHPQERCPTGGLLRGARVCPFVH